MMLNATSNSGVLNSADLDDGEEKKVDLKI